ncbi:hypothetical protein LX69_00362 [Breznakibacter xylanolyticus]|uniref:Long-subunit fatty acid transport protein n=1 Tax=Breznakibacter xylanolyticus TaxID=990 RepID=A0A2W7NIX8_9BACT|nr:hypothetical protein [Breznakibacter xylanolyticus]PZX20365.1 hypothetical protein LX69_00362 [Breznakibacter xylanolyticus]
MNSINKIQSAIVGVMMMMMGISVTGQHQTGSPYSMFGVGTINPGGDVAAMSMGGAGFALPSQNRINLLNPASLTGIDTLAFLMNAQLGGYMSRYGTSASTQNASDANFDAVSFAFRIKPWWGCAFGLNTYSHIGYTVSSTNDIHGSFSTYSNQYKGSGGVTRLQLSNGFRLAKGLSVGIETSLLWGQLVSTETSQFSSISGQDISNERTYHLSNFYFSGGLQYQLDIDTKNTLMLGLVANAKTTLATSYNQMIASSGGEQYVNKDDRAADYQLPVGGGLGFAYRYNNTWTLAVDGLFGQWSDVDKDMRYAKYTDSYGVNAGLEYAPQKNAFQSVFYRMKYRAGLFYRNTYLNISGNDIVERGFSAGISIPMRNVRNAIHLGYEYKLLGTQSAGLIQEQVNTVKIGMLLSETWFFKSKFE